MQENENFKPIVKGVCDFINDENIDILSKILLVFKIGEHLNKNEQLNENN